MKKITLEFLTQKGLEHIFSESQFNSYKQKVTKGKKAVNQHFAGLAIADLFIINNLG